MQNIQEILRLHALWLEGSAEGVRANLSGADLSRADLHWASLSEANLSGANLRGANLSGANLRRADLRRANLRGADLSGANLRGADLSGANLRRADLRGAKYSYQQIVPQEGSFIGWKKVNKAILKLQILSKSKRSSATGRKCRAQSVKVLKAYTLNTFKEHSEKSFHSNYDPNFIYTVGSTVSVPDFNGNWWEECTSGIHFFLSKEEANAY